MIMLFVQSNHFSVLTHILFEVYNKNITSKVVVALVVGLKLFKKMKQRKAFYFENNITHLV